jgi:PD-(D/E)XK nuclease superfamily protein
MRHPKDIGDETTLAVMAALRHADLAVLLPFGENTRYDLVIDDGLSFSRVQCKTGRLRDGAVRFNVCSCYGHHQRPGDSRRGYLGQIEFFGVYCPETTGVYLVPITDVPLKSQAALRVDEPRNNQRRNIRKASDYEIGRISVRVTARLGATAGAPAPSA